MNDYDEKPENIDNNSKKIEDKDMSKVAGGGVVDSVRNLFGSKKKECNGMNGVWIEHCDNFKPVKIGPNIFKCKTCQNKWKTSYYSNEPQYMIES